MKTGCCHSKLIHQTDRHAICINPGCENYLGHTSANIDYSKWKNTFAAVALTFLLLFSFDDFSKENKEQYTLALLLPTQHEILTIARVQKELKTQEVMCPKEVLAQIKIESANLTSSLFRRTNNMFGMRYPFNRKTTASGIYIPSLDSIVYGSRDELKKFRRFESYAVFNTWKASIADYKLWQEHYFNVSERYLEFIGKNYAEDPFYVAKIRQAASLPQLK